MKWLKRILTFRIGRGFYDREIDGKVEWAPTLTVGLRDTFDVHFMYRERPMQIVLSVAGDHCQYFKRLL